MKPNICPATGIRYGVLSRSDYNGTIAESFNEILETVMSDGVNLTADARQEHFREDLTGRLAEWKEDHLGDDLKITDLGRSLDMTNLSHREVQDILDAADGSTSDEALKQIVDDMVSCSSFYDESGEDTYHYYSDEDAIEIISGTLGGARYLEIVASPWVVRCRLCSPCVPNAGDLNAPDICGEETFTLPRDWLVTEDDTEAPYPYDIRIEAPDEWEALVAHNAAARKTDAART